MRFSDQDTIYAPCSPPGQSLAAIVRLSGSEALAAADGIFTADNGTPLREAAGGDVISGTVSLPFSTRLPCPALACVMRAPASFTREDVVEFHVPGGAPIVRALCRALAAQGLRPAEGGEFTLRAFLHGRIDLGQAEAVEQIVCANSEDERRAAVSRLSHQLTKSIGDWRARLLELSALLEASLDFDEEEFAADRREEMLFSLRKIAGDCRELAAKSGGGVVGKGARVALAGLTNAGKSSLLNRLCGYEAALVSPEKSTTRDLLEREIVLGRQQVTIADLPGFDLGDDIATGLSRRTGTQLQTFGVVCLVADCADENSFEELRGMFSCLHGAVVIPVLNKIDLLPDAEKLFQAKQMLSDLIAGETGNTPARIIELSAVTGEGLDSLRHEIEAAIVATLSTTSSGSLSAREAAELAVAATACTQAAVLLGNGHGLELVAEELRAAYEAMSRATGQGYAEDILENIFSRFCIGK